MGILQITPDEVGQVSQLPRTVKIVTTDALAVVTAAGYLNPQTLLSNVIYPSDIINMIYSWSNATQNGTYAVFRPSFSGSTITLTEWSNPGEVVLPVVSNDFANFSGTAGVIKDSGYSPSDPLKTKVVMANGAVVANRFGKFTDTAGTIDDATSAGTNLGDIYAGADAVAGAFRSYSATTATGYLGLAAVANGGAFAVNYSNDAHGQSTTYKVTDVANANGRLLNAASATPFTSGNFPVASGVAGLMVDSGLAAANIQNKTNIKAATTADIGGGGAGPISVAVAGLTTASVVVASIESSSNAVAVAKCNATGTGFDITFTGDPGVACLVNYVAFIAAQ